MCNINYEKELVGNSNTILIVSDSGKLVPEIVPNFTSSLTAANLLATSFKGIIDAFEYLSNVVHQIFKGQL